MGIFFFKLIVIWALLTFHDCQGPGVNPHGKCLPFPRNAFWWAVEKLIPRSDFGWSLCFAHLKIVGHIGLGLFFQWSRICFTWLCAGSWIDRKSKMLSKLHPLSSPVFKFLFVLICYLKITTQKIGVTSIFRQTFALGWNNLGAPIRGSETYRLQSLPGSLHEKL